MIRRIDLDYVQHRSRTGWAVLGIGVIAAVAAAVLYAGLSERSGRWEKVTQKAAARNAAVAAVRDNPEDRRRLALQVESANEVIGRLSLPWNELFRSIEDSAIDTVALLSVQPQPQQRLVALNGEARSYADVLEYMQRLDASGAFAHTRLLSHKVKREDPRHPVAFAIAAGWRVAP
jgi:Tfp pilus assembly protein PilN